MRYPRLMCYGTQWHGLPDGVDRELRAARSGRYQWMTSWRWPEHIAQLKAAGVEQVLYQIEIQRLPHTPNPNEIPWNLKHVLSKLVNQRGWWLKTPTGEHVLWDGQPVVDWTKPEVAAAFSRTINDWRLGIDSGHTGLLLEVAPGHPYKPWLKPAPEPWDIFEARWASTSLQFMRDFCQRISGDPLRCGSDAYPVVFGGDSFAPTEIFKPAGILIEDFLHRFAAPVLTATEWRHEFDGVPARKRGLLYAQRRCGTTANTIVKQLWHGDHVSYTTRRREALLALCTTSLTDALYTYVSRNPEEPMAPKDEYVIPEMDMDFGQPLGPYRQTSAMVYVRQFTKARVEVNLATMTGRVVR